MFEKLPKFNLKLHEKNKISILEINANVTKQKGSIAMPMICVREDPGLTLVLITTTHSTLSIFSLFPIAFTW
jgi:hypothetical protein